MREKKERKDVLDDTDVHKEGCWRTVGARKT